MDGAEAFSLIARAIDTGRAAHGYLIVGDVRGNGAELVRRILLKLFPHEVAQVESGEHPDVATLAPEGKSRVITVDAMRERIVEPMSATAFSGGWKVGVIVGADRLRPESANAFLKSLEEPTPRTMYLLLTDQPDVILPTIVSRTQRVDLPLPAGVLEGDDFDRVAAAFAAKDAAALVAILKELKDGADDADVPLVRKAFYRTLMGFARQMMVKGKLPRHLAFRNVEAVEDAYRQSDRANMGDDMVISFLLDRITLPGERAS